MATASQIKANAKYDSTHCTGMYLKFNNGTDSDILEKLASVSNRQGYIKQLIRDDIARTDSVPEGMQAKTIVMYEPKGMPETLKETVESMKRHCPIVPKIEKKEGNHMTYHIKPEYYDLWLGDEDTRDPETVIVTDDDIERLSVDWGTSIDELKEQLIAD